MYITVYIYYVPDLAQDMQKKPATHQPRPTQQLFIPRPASKHEGYKTSPRQYTSHPTSWWSSISICIAPSYSVLCISYRYKYLVQCLTITSSIQHHMQYSTFNIISICIAHLVYSIIYSILLLQIRFIIYTIIYIYIYVYYPITLYTNLHGTAFTARSIRRYSKTRC